LFRVNRRSIVWLAPRYQGHYEKRLKQLTRLFSFLLDNASLRRGTAIKASRGGVALLVLVSALKW
jgi:hypothetical protein